MQGLYVLFVMVIASCAASPVATIREVASRANVVEDLFFLSAKEEMSMDEEALHLTVIEKIKARILRSLNLKEKPKSHAPIPPLQSFRFMKTFWRNDGSISLNETVRQHLRSEFMPSEIVPNTCFDRFGPQCVRFQIQIPNHISLKNSLSELWLYKKRGVTEFRFSQLIDSPGQMHLKRVQFIVTNQTESEGWIRFDATKLLRTSNVLDLEVFSNSLSVEKDKKPLLIVLSKKAGRSKRTTDCIEENTSCCRKKVYISFKDVGWDDWIVQPEGYNANICKGSCHNIVLADKHHAHVLISYMSKHSNSEINNSIHCSPKAYKPLSIIYSDDKGVKVSDLPDMSVAECACS